VPDDLVPPTEPLLEAGEDVVDVGVVGLAAQGFLELRPGLGKLLQLREHRTQVHVELHGGGIELHPLPQLLGRLLEPPLVGEDRPEVQARQPVLG
jgi:hypothetical protein